MAFSVAARIRGPPVRASVVVAKDDRSLLLSNGDLGGVPQLFTLDRVFGPSVTQREVFTSLSPDLLRDFLDGGNVGVIMHGAAASGKSFSLLGSPDALDGLAVRVLEAVFSHCMQNTSYSFRLHLSFVAVHDKYALDLLAEHQRPLGVTKVGRAYEVEGLTKHSLNNRAAFVELVQRGCRALVGSLPNLVLSLYLTRTRREQVVTSSCRFVDLMPAEFPLDRSLSLLGSCLRKLTDPSAGQASFRDCLLTQLLKDSLRGRFCLVACLDPSQYLSSFHTLSFVSTSFNLDKSGPQHSFQYYRWIISRTAGARAFVQVAFVQFLGALGQPVLPVGVSSPRRSPEAPLLNGPENVTRASGLPWIDYDTKPELVFDFGSSVTLQGYEFFVSPEAPEGEPVAWEFQASNDLKEWFVLDRQERAGRRRSSTGSFRKPKPAPKDGNFFQWYRWTITGVKPALSPPSMQASKVVFYKGTVKINPISVAEQSLSVQPPSLLLDGQVNSKWVKLADTASLVFDFGAGVSLSGFEWFTAADFLHSDPTMWMMEGSTDLTSWQLLAEYPPPLPRSHSSGLFSWDKKASVRPEDDSRELARLQVVHKALVEAADQATQAAQHATRLHRQAVADSESAGASLQAALQTNIQLQRKAQAAQEHNQQLLALSESQQQRLLEQEAKLTSQIQQEAAALRPVTELCQLILQFADPFLAGLGKEKQASAEGGRTGRRRSHGALAALPLDATPLQSLSHVHVFLCALKEEWDNVMQHRASLENSLRAKTDEAAVSRKSFEQSSTELSALRKELRAEMDQGRVGREQLARIVADKTQLEAALLQAREKSNKLEAKLAHAEGNEKQLETWRAKSEELQASLVPILAQRVQLEQAMTEEQTRASHERHEAQQQHSRLQAQIEVLQAQLDRHPLQRRGSQSSGYQFDGEEVEEAQSSAEPGVRALPPSSQESNALSQQLTELRQHNERLEATQLQATKDIEQLKTELENQQLRHAEQLRQAKEPIENALHARQLEVHLDEIRRLKAAFEAQAQQLAQLQNEEDVLISPDSQLQGTLQATQRELEDQTSRMQQLSAQSDRYRLELVQLQQQRSADAELLRSKVALLDQQQKEFDESKLAHSRLVAEANDDVARLSQELEVHRNQHKEHLEQWKAEIEDFVAQLEHQRSQHKLEIERIQEHHQQVEALTRRRYEAAPISNELFVEPTVGQSPLEDSSQRPSLPSSQEMSVTRALETQHAAQLQSWKEQFEGLTQQMEQQREQHRKQAQDLHNQIEALNQRLAREGPSPDLNLEIALKEQHTLELQNVTTELENLHKQQIHELQTAHQREVSSHQQQAELLSKQIDAHHQQRDSLNQRIGALASQLERLEMQIASLQLSKQEEIDSVRSACQTQLLEQKRQVDDLTRQFELHKAASEQHLSILHQQHHQELLQMSNPSQELRAREQDDEVQKLKIELEAQQAQLVEQSQAWQTQLENLQAAHNSQLDAVKQRYELKSPQQHLIIESPLRSLPSGSLFQEHGVQSSRDMNGDIEGTGQHMPPEVQLADREPAEHLDYLKQQLELISQEVTALRQSEFEAKVELQERNKEVDKLKQECQLHDQALQQRAVRRDPGEEEAEFEQLKQEYEFQKQELAHLHQQAREFEGLHSQVGQFEKQMKDFELLQQQTEEQKRHLDELELERETARQEAAGFRQKQREFELFEQKVRDYDKQIEGLQNLQNQAEDVARDRRQFRAQQEELGRREQHIERQTKELERQRQEHERRTDQFEGLQEQIEAFAQQSQQYHALQRQMKQLERKFKEAENTNPKSADYDKQKEELGILQQQVEELCEQRQQNVLLQQQAKDFLQQKLDHEKQWGNSQQQQVAEMQRLQAELQEEDTQRQQLATQVTELHEKNEQQKQEIEQLKKDRAEYERHRQGLGVLQERLAKFLPIFGKVKQSQSAEGDKQHQLPGSLELDEKVGNSQPEHEQLHGESSQSQSQVPSLDELQSAFAQIEHQQLKQAQEMEELAEELHWKQVEHEQELEELQVRLQRSSQNGHLKDGSDARNGHVQDNSDDRNNIATARSPKTDRAAKVSSDPHDTAKEQEIERLREELEAQKERYAVQLHQLEMLTQQFEHTKKQQPQQTDQQRAHVQELELEIQRLTTQLDENNHQLAKLQTQHREDLRLSKEQSDDLAEHLEKQHRHQMEELQQQHVEQVEALTQSELKAKQQSVDELKRLQMENATAEAVTSDLLRLALPGVVNGQLKWGTARDLVKRYAAHKQASDQNLAQLSWLLLPTEPPVGPFPSSEQELARLNRMTLAAKELQSQAALARDWRAPQEEELADLEALHELLLGDGKEIKQSTQDKERAELTLVRAERNRLQANLKEVLSGVDGLQRAYLEQTLEIRRYISDAEQASKRLRELETELTRLAEGEGSHLTNGENSHVEPGPTVEQALFSDAEFLHGEPCLGSAVHSRMKVEFRRPRDCYPNPSLFDVIEPSDVRQGTLGDCWLMSSVAALAEFPELIKKVFKESDISFDGSYTCRLYDVETKRFAEIKIDDMLPCKPGGTPAFAQSKTGELWPCLLEKAFAKWMGNYSILSGGWPALALEALTGSESLLYRFMGEEIKALSFRGLSLKKAASTGAKSYTTGRSWSADSFFEELKGFDDQGFIMTLASAGKDVYSEAQGPSDDFGIVGGHAYSLLSVAACSGFQLCQVRNPWGDFEWGGDWSDRSDLWRQYPEVKTQLRPRLDKDDGVFWMPYRDLLKAFTSITVNLVHRPKVR